ncbi:PH domain-containing protein [Capnocytophaga sp.]|uniref:PH domain-containing protein n=1 Tax=Capnocytophaga sp. TaxID=44737 RepID=UPI0026DC884D|nr:PH domain-containing protein [Capnocytophaga sp.]MDO5104392.1 PH domain-containing protein [Capnocytophaga sp.]
MTEYKPKIDRWSMAIGLLFTLFSVGIVVWSIPTVAVILTSLIAVIIVLILMLIGAFSVKYQIDGDKFIGRIGCFYKKEIDIHSIRKIEKTKSILNTPLVTSFDRIEIFYNRYDSVMLSPLDKEVFIADLKRINPRIEVIS